MPEDCKKRETFFKEEHLKSKKEIDSLFQKGKVVVANPIRLVHLFLSESEQIYPKVLFSVSKRNFKKAVDRNRIKRQMREVYRRSRSQYFSDKTPNPYLLGIIYTSREKIPFEILEKKLNLALERLKAIPR
jgi:ribonuclease P protein component